MIRIGLVGDIGAGKSFVGKNFRFPLFNADQEVKKIYKKNKYCFNKLNQKFPDHIKKFPISKNEIKKLLNKKNIKIISKIVHPYVRVALRNFLNKNYSKKHVVLDIPLLIENKLNKKSDIIIFVKTPKKIIQKRLKKRGIYNKKVIEILKSQQIKIDKKIKLSRFVVDNSKNKKEVIKEIKQIKKKLND